MPAPTPKCLDFHFCTAVTNDSPVHITPSVNSVSLFIIAISMVSEMLWFMILLMLFVNKPNDINLSLNACCSVLLVVMVVCYLFLSVSFCLFVFFASISFFMFFSFASISFFVFFVFV